MPKKTVGTTAVALGGLVVAADWIPRGVQIKADDDNAGSVYIGYADTVTAGSADATDGMRLTAGQSYLVPPAKAAYLGSIYLIASQASQVVYYDRV